MGRCDKKTLSLYYKGTEWERQEVLQLREPLTAKTSGGDQRSGSGRYSIDQGIGCGADSQPRQHIQNGVLLEEYGRQADEHGHGQKAPSRQPLARKRRMSRAEKYTAKEPMT